MSRNLGDNVANMVKGNFAFQFVLFTSGQITFRQFLSAAIFRPFKVIVGGFLLFALLILMLIEGYCWYIEHTSFTYHLIKGDLASISGANSRTHRNDKNVPVTTKDVNQAKSDVALVKTDQGVSGNSAEMHTSSSSPNIKSTYDAYATMLHRRQTALGSFV